MKYSRIFLILALFLILSSLSLADIPNLINFQGILDSAGNPLANRTLGVEFKIYDADAGGNALWSETTTVITNAGGVFTTILGSSNPIPDSVFNDTARWLGTKVGTNPEIAPRQKLVSVPYSYRVGTVDGASGGALTGDLSVGGQVGIGTTTPNGKLGVSGGDIGVDEGGQNTGTTSYGLRFGGFGSAEFIGSKRNAGGNQFGLDFYTNNQNRVSISNGGNVGIGTTNPVYRLTVNQTTPSTYAAHIFTSGLAAGTSYGLTVSGGTNSNDASFAARNQAGTALLFVRGDGNVGIGTTTPASPLEVFYNNNSSTSPAIAINNGTGFQDVLDFKFGGVTQGRIRMASGGGLVLGTVAPLEVIFTTADLGRMVISNAGNVGIGTTSPQGALDVSSTTGAFIVPRMTTAQRDALTAVNGMIIYNTTTNQFNFREAGAWVTK